jgi:hypothetical protein
MSGQFKDFDAAWAEQQDEPIKVKIRNKEYDLPASVSAAFMLEVTKISSRKGSEDNLTTADMGVLLNALFGKVVIEDWLEQGISLPQLNDILSYVLEIYGLTGGGADPKATPKVDSTEKPVKDK